MEPLEQEQQQKQQQLQEQEYNGLVNQIKPKPPVWRNTLLAFLVGGAICSVGQLLQYFYQWCGLSGNDVGAATSATMIFLGAFLTGLGVYDQIGRVGGAGSIVPITGFANSIVAPAMEFKREGYVFGVGARIFTIAGPVLVYGFLVSTLAGIIHFLWR
jgi:stage V sporulation protein AC